MSDIHVMIDIETLGTRKDAVITQIAAVPFDKERVYSSERFNAYLKIEPQVDRFRTVSDDTLIWWLKQSQEARTRLLLGLMDAEHPMAALSNFNNWLALCSNKAIPQSWSDVAGIWSKGPSFDIAMIEHLSEDCEITPPLSKNFRKFRDVRTMEDYVSEQDREDILNGVVGLLGDSVAHDAVYDCVYQAKLVQAAWRRIEPQIITVDIEPAINWEVPDYNLFEGYQNLEIIPAVQRSDSIDTADLSGIEVDKVQEEPELERIRPGIIRAS